LASSWATNDATEILKETIDEEEETDKLLTGIARQLNPKAESTDESTIAQSNRGMMTGQSVRTGCGVDGGCQVLAAATVLPRAAGETAAAAARSPFEQSRSRSEQLPRSRDAASLS
jgi:hypothetical protein